MPRPRPPGIHVWEVVGRKPRTGKGLCPRCGKAKEDPKSGWCNECKKQWAQSHRESHRRSQSKYARSENGRRNRRDHKIRQRGLAGTAIRASDEHIRPELAKFRKGEISDGQFKLFLRNYLYEESRRILLQLRLNKKKPQ